MSSLELVKVAQAMVAEGKGILAIDESTGTCQKRFDSIGVECTEENRRQYREMLLTTPGLGDHVSGAILFDETLRQSKLDGTSFIQVMTDAGILPGIKVDKGAHNLAGHGTEKVTEGLDGLRDLHRSELPCTCPLCCTLPGSRNRADGRARSLIGRLTFY
jgi:fructose-bisphosphate aldolase class I